MKTTTMKKIDYCILMLTIFALIFGTFSFMVWLGDFGAPLIDLFFE
jgi:hypothetical protein